MIKMSQYPEHLLLSWRIWQAGFGRNFAYTTMYDLGTYYEQWLEVKRAELFLHSFCLYPKLRSTEIRFLTFFVNCREFMPCSLMATFADSGVYFSHSLQLPRCSFCGIVFRDPLIHNHREQSPCCPFIVFQSLNR
jgi:hypothetical protein